MSFWKKEKFKIHKSPTGDEAKSILAFELNGIKYRQLESAFQMHTGRALCAIAYYEEFQQRCDKNYLLKHCRAVDILLSDPKRIMIGQIAMLHENLKERVNFAPYPDHIYKLASVMYFDDNEDPFSYDFHYNQKKIKAWKGDPKVLSFLVSQPLKELTPFGEVANTSLQTYFQVKEAENQYHLKMLDRILLRN